MLPYEVLDVWRKQNDFVIFFTENLTAYPNVEKYVDERQGPYTQFLSNRARQRYDL